MIFNIELPKKINKFNYFKKEEKGCKLYSYNEVLNGGYYIVVDYPDLEIEKDFTIIDSTLNAIIMLNPGVELKLNEKNVVATSKKGRYTGKYVENKFSILNKQYTNSCMLNLDVLNKASSFTSANEKKPILTGVNVDENGKVVATDSFKVYRYISEENGIENPSSITISTTLIKLAYALFNNKNIQVEYNVSSVCMRDENVMLVGNLLTGDFPKIDIIFNQINGEGCEISKNELLDAISFTKIAGANTDIKRVPLYATLGNGKYIGEADEKFEKEIDYNGDEVVFDALFLEITLKAFDNEKVIIHTLKKERGSMSKFGTENNPNEEIVLLGIAK